MIRLDLIKSEANTRMLHPKSPVFHQMIIYHLIFHTLPIPIGTRPFFIKSMAGPLGERSPTTSVSPPWQRFSQWPFRSPLCSKGFVTYSVRCWFSTSVGAQDASSWWLPEPCQQITKKSYFSSYYKPSFDNPSWKSYLWSRAIRNESNTHKHRKGNASRNQKVNAKKITWLSLFVGLFKVPGLHTDTSNMHIPSNVASRHKAVYYLSSAGSVFGWFSSSHPFHGKIEHHGNQNDQYWWRCDWFSGIDPSESLESQTKPQTSVGKNIAIFWKPLSAVLRPIWNVLLAFWRCCGHDFTLCIHDQLLSMSSHREKTGS